MDSGVSISATTSGSASPAGVVSGPGTSFAGSRRIRLLGDGVWVASGQVLAALGTLLGARILMEVVAPAIFGAVSLLMAIAMLGYNSFCSPLLLAGLRFYSGVVQPGDQSALRRALARMLRRSTVAVAVLCLGIGGVWAVIQGSWTWQFAALVGVVVADAARAFEITLLTAARRQRPVAIWVATEAWGRPLLAFAAVIVFKASTEVVLTAYCIASLACWLLFRCTIPREGVEEGSEAGSSAPPAAVSSDVKRELMQYALPLVPLALATWITSFSDRYIIGGVLGVDQVGIYAAAIALVSRPFLMVASIVSQTLRPLYFKAVSCSDRTEEQRVFRLWLALVAGIALLGIGAFWALGNIVGNLLLASNYRTGILLFQGMAVGYALSIIAGIMGERLLAYKRTGFLMITQAVMAVAYLGLFWVLVHRSGLHGAVMAFALYSLGSTVALGLVGWRLAVRSHSYSQSQSQSEPEEEEGVR